jgi:hypothetical protein
MFHAEKGFAPQGRLLNGNSGRVIMRRVVSCLLSVVRPFTMLYRIMGKPQFFRIPARPTWDEFSLEESDEGGM